MNLANSTPLAVAYCFHLFYARWRPPHYIAYIFSAVRDVAVFHALFAFSSRMKPYASLDHSDPFPELFGFPPPSSVCVGRFFIELIVLFSSFISCLGRKVFHQINQLFLNVPLEAKRLNVSRVPGFSFLVLVRLERFFTNFMNFGRDAHSASSSNFARFLSISSTSPRCSLSMSSTSPRCSLLMSDMSLPVVWFSFSVSH